MEQLTDEWFAERAGKITASRMADVMAKIKGGAPGAGRKNYAADLVVERMTGQKASSFSNAAMQWGIDMEPHAREAYEAAQGVSVDEVGFISHFDIENSGASPDGLLGDDGMLEIKCPNTATHIEYLLAGKPPQKYYDQMQWQMECADRQWCDFVSYDPRMPERHQLLIVRIDRDDARIDELRTEVIALDSEVNSMIEQLEGRLNGK